jgi:uncharacterized membrane protein YidH (DUF202 family)
MAQTGHGGARIARVARDLAFEVRAELARALMEAERTMMQTVQLSLSLIGFGFTITEFFNGSGLQSHREPRARLVGEALLVLGLLLLAMGLWTHARYRRRLVREIRRVGPGPTTYGLRLRNAPSFIIAVLLLGVGLLALASVLVGRIF